MILETAIVWMNDVYHLSGISIRDRHSRLQRLLNMSETADRQNGDNDNNGYNYSPLRIRIPQYHPMKIFL